MYETKAQASFFLHNDVFLSCSSSFWLCFLFFSWLFFSHCIFFISYWHCYSHWCCYPIGVVAIHVGTDFCVCCFVAFLALLHCYFFLHYLVAFLVLLRCSSHVIVLLFSSCFIVLFVVLCYYFCIVSLLHLFSCCHITFLVLPCYFFALFHCFSHIVMLLFLHYSFHVATLLVMMLLIPSHVFKYLLAQLLFVALFALLLLFFSRWCCSCSFPWYGTSPPLLALCKLKLWYQILEH